MRAPRPLFVLASGIFALILTMGVARFAYTPMLAYMQPQTGMGDALAGWLAGWNYLGYLTGVLLVTQMRDLMRKEWWLLTGVGCLLLIPAWGWLPRPNQGLPLNTVAADTHDEPGPLWLWLLQAAGQCPA